MTTTPNSSTTQRRSIALIGLRGAGKTTVGRLLARRMGLPFVDTDQMITARAGKSIADIFRDDGEAAFRALEKQVIAKVTRDAPSVISAGGGAVLDPDNVAQLRSAGVVIWLTAPPETLWQRIRQDAGTHANRPALTTRNGPSELRELLNRRQDHYRAAAEIIVDTTSRTAAEVVESVCKELSSPGS